MTKADRDQPWTETERLAALRRTGLMNTPSELAYDDLVRLAADLIGVPMAAVHLVAEDRQWGKAEVGLGVREIPRDIAFCPLAMLEPQGLVVPDATKDPRFANNPLVTGAPGIRFYAGMPLVTEGLPIGALCVIDTKPHEDGLDERQRFALKALAAQVSSQIALRRALAQRDELLVERAQADARQRQTLNSATDYAIISTDLHGWVTAWNVGAENVLGWTEAEMLGQTAERFFTPEDRAGGRMKLEMQGALEAGRADNERWRLRKDGQRIYARGAMTPLRTEAGDAVGFVIVLRDRTEQYWRQEREAALAALAVHLRGLEDPQTIMEVAAEAVGRHLRVHRVGFFEVSDDTLRFTVGWVDGTLPRLKGTWPAASIGTAYLAEVRRGAVLGIADMAQDPLTADASFAEIGTRSGVGYPVMRDGRWVAGFYVNHAEPRTWLPEEVAFVGAVGELAWDTVQRAEAQAELRASEARWHAIFQYMHEGFALCEMVHGEDGSAVDFRYVEVNQAWERLTGVPAGITVGRLGSEVFPGLERFWTDTYARVVETGEPANFEYQISSIGRWFQVFAYRTEPRRFAALFLNVTERRATEERQALLAREVDHRAKNALAVVQAALRLTKATDVPSYVKAIEGRVDALARAQAALAQDRWAGADLRTLLEGELAPFLGLATGAGPRARLEGPRVSLPAGAAQSLAMAVHELATNAVKHGALSMPEGRITVSWHLGRGENGRPLLKLRWAEAGGPPVRGAPERRGFGSRVLDGTLRGQLGGLVSLVWEPSGLLCEIEAPLRARPDSPGAANLSP